MQKDPRVECAWRFVLAGALVVVIATSCGQTPRPDTGGGAPRDGAGGAPGECRPACRLGEACVSGACRCASGLDRCASGCTDLGSDGSNCGTCGNVCSGGLVCSSGRCGAVCSGGTVLCGSSCVSLSDNVTHCGACNRSCT